MSSKPEQHTSPPDPAEALDSIREAQASVAGRIGRANTVGYDLLYALIVGVMVSAPGLPTPWNTGLIALCVLALLLLARGWANATGVWVSGVAPRRARWVAIGLGVLLAAFLLGGLLLTKVYDVAWATVALGAVAAVLAFAASRLWWRVYLKEAGAGR